MAAATGEVTLSSLVEALHRVREESNELPVSMLITLLAIAEMISDPLRANKNEISFFELGERVGIPYPTVSRHIRYLGPGLVPGKPGLGLMQTDEQPMNRRKKFVELTPKGKRFISQFMTIAGIRR